MLKNAIALASLCCLAACGGGSEPAESFAVFPLKIYTGFDESGGYSAPVAAMGGAGVTWACTQDTIASVAGDDSLATVSGRSAGTAKINATAGAEVLTIDIFVTRYQ